MKQRFRFIVKGSPPPVRFILMMTLILFIILTTFSIWIIDKGINPPLMAIAEEKTIEFATRTINAAVKSTENMNYDDLVDMQFDSEGNITTLGWDSATVTKALRTATERAEYFLYGMNKGETIDMNDPELDPIEFGDSVGDLAKKDPTVVEIPIGQATGSTTLANLGPKIPVHLEIVGSLQSDIVHEVQEFGVNAALLEVYIPVLVQVQIVVPFMTDVAEINTDIFIDSRIVMGKVPEFFNHGGDGGPSISVPRRSSEKE